jgi:hypothetical protein
MLSLTIRIIGRSSPQDIPLGRQKREEKGYFCETVRETRGSERRMLWLLRHWSAGADEGEVLVARGDALNVAEASVL